MWQLKSRLADMQATAALSLNASAGSSNAELSVQLPTAAPAMARQHSEPVAESDSFDNAHSLALPASKPRSNSVGSLAESGTQQRSRGRAPAIDSPNASPYITSLPGIKDEPVSPINDLSPTDSALPKSVSSLASSLAEKSTSVDLKPLNSHAPSSLLEARMLVVSWNMGAKEPSPQQLQAHLPQVFPPNQNNGVSVRELAPTSPRS